MREICGEKVLSAEGRDVIDFSHLVRLNETSAYLWQALEGKDFDAEMMCGLLCEQYDVTPERALEDSKVLIRQFIDIGLVEL
ncbi:MAG: PqqD family protein [Candidatus Cryptobacteroides sp.]